MLACWLIRLHFHLRRPLEGTLGEPETVSFTVGARVNEDVWFKVRSVSLAFCRCLVPWFGVINW